MSVCLSVRLSLYLSLGFCRNHSDLSRFDTRALVSLVLCSEWKCAHVTICKAPVGKSEREAESYTASRCNRGVYVRERETPEKETTESGASVSACVSLKSTHAKQSAKASKAAVER